MHSGEPEWGGRRRTGATALAGLHHYVGLVLGKLKKRGPVDNSDLREFTIALGGRGSTIFRYLDAGGDASALVSIAKVVVMGDGSLTPPDKIEPRFSSMPKEELARGMLLNGDARGAAGQRIKFEPAGLGVVIEKGKESIQLEPTDDIRDAGSASDVKEVSLDGLKQFRCEMAQAVFGARPALSSTLRSESKKKMHCVKRVERLIYATVSAPHYLANSILNG
jgi:hypothetical protein